jgi:hypothetical protein
MGIVRRGHYRINSDRVSLAQVWFNRKFHDLFGSRENEGKWFYLIHNQFILLDSLFISRHSELV